MLFADKCYHINNANVMQKDSADMLGLLHMGMGRWSIGLLSL